MQHDAQKYLHDILDSCGFLLEFTSGRSLDDYTRDRAFRDVVERELQIVGEAVLRLDKSSPQIAARISEHRRIIGFRNILVHGYDSLKPETVWGIVIEKLPLLRAEIEVLLRGMP